MNANELMLGNYVNYLGNPTRVTSISGTDKFYIATFTSGIFHESNYSPIPLTEKWLLDFGFKQNELTFSLANDEYSITIFFCDLWQFQYETPLESVNLVNDFKVHELQNLFYSLTGRFLQLVGQTNG